MAPKHDGDVELPVLDKGQARANTLPQILHPPHDDVSRDQLVKPGSSRSHSSDSESSVTGSDDEFDWDAEDDGVSQHRVSGATKAKRGHAVYKAFLRLPKFFRAILVGVIGAGILITPLLVIQLRFNAVSVREQVRAFSLWLSISWAAGVAIYIIVDAVPHLILFLLKMVGYKVERARLTIELVAAVRGWLKLALDMGLTWIILSVIRATFHPPGSYWVIVNRVMQALFAAGMLLLAEKVFLRYVAINFHRKALADRLTENQLGLRALDRLSNATPTAAKRTPYASAKKGHKSRASSVDALRQATGSSSSSPINEKDSRPPSPVDKRSKKQRRRKRGVAAVIVDSLGGALGEVAQNQYGSLASAGKLARKLFSTLSDVHPPRKHLIVDDFIPYFSTTQDAHTAFNLFDKDGNGDISKKEMREAVRRIYRERKALTASLKDVGSAVAKLDAVLLGLVLLIFIFICLLIFNRNNTVASLVPLATIIVGFSFIFGHSAQTLFESLIFIFSTHVFDVGDLVMIDDQPLFVKEFGLFSTTFRRVDGQEIIAPNALLASAKLIHNLRRSNSMWESTTLMVAYDTPLEAIEQLRLRLGAYATANSREWSAVSLNIDKMEYQNAIHLVVAMEHRPNWQDWGGRWMRRTAFMRNLKTILEELDLRYAAPIQPVLVQGRAGGVGGALGSPGMLGPLHAQDLGNAGGFRGAEFLARSSSRSIRSDRDRF